MAILKKIPLLVILLFSALLLSAQNPKADAIKKRMTEIRQTTNWKDKEAAAKANQEISKLAKELMMMKAPPEAQQGAPPGQGNAPDEITRQNVESKMALWETIWGAAKKGRDARLDLAKSLRDTIVAEYREDDSPQVKCPEWFNKMNVLYIDMSMPGVEQVISQMERYQAIETLIITGGEHGAPVDLDDLLRRASHYPLKALYIINFRLFVDDIPSSVGGFTSLTEAGFFNNALHSLPPALGSLASLKLLYLDKNPVNTLMPLVASFTNLRTLGLGMTSIPEAEIQTISGLLPECKILR